MASKLDDQVGRVIKPAERADTPHSILVKTYTGKQGEATALFQADCIEMATQAYFPTWQSWTPGEWARETYIFAVGAVRDVVGIWSGAISDIVKLSDYAARSIG